jgi:hypothetical protein
MSQSPAPNDPSKGLPPWLLFAFLVIGPPAGIIALARTITQNPVVIALLVVLYEVLVFVVNKAKSGQVLRRRVSNQREE